MRPTDNLLLAALPEAERDAIIGVARRVRLDLGDILYEQDDEVHEVHFLTSGGASVLIAMDDGRGFEPAIVGREGILGFPFGLGDNRSRWRSVMELPGEGYALPNEAFADIIRESRELAPLLTHYSGLLLTFVAQSGACAQFHSVRQRASRWLLLLHDRAEADDFPITHEWLAYMLGTHRPSVTIALNELADAGLVELHRAHLRVVNRARLEAITCECYARVQIPFEEAVYAPSERARGRAPYQPGRDAPGSHRDPAEGEGTA